MAPSKKRKKDIAKDDSDESEDTLEDREKEEDEEYLELDEAMDDEEAPGTGYVVKKKPELPAATSKALELRKERKSKMGKFRRQEWFRYKRLGTKWRRPRGLHSKMRRKLKYRPKMPSAGYGSPKEAKHLLPSGFREVMVFNPRDVETIEPTREAARIGHTVGSRKRTEILKKAHDLGVRVLNPGGV